MTEVLNAFGIDWRLIVIQIFNFTILMGALWYFLYTPILKIIRERQEKIAEGVQDAEDAKVLKEHAEDERLKLLGEANKEAEDTLERAKGLATEKSASIISAAEAKAGGIIENATAKGEENKAKLHKESEAEIAKLAVLAAERVLKEKSS